MLPWSFFLPAAVTGIWRQRTSRDGDRRLYLFIWAALIFLFFSKSDSKLIPYILPVFPAAALLLGKAFADLWDRPSRLLRTSAAIVAGVLVVGGGVLIAYPHFAPRPEVTPVAGAVLGIIFAVEGGAVLLSLRRADTTRLFASLCLLSYLAGIAALLFVMPTVAAKKNTKKLGLLIHRLAPPEAVAATFTFEQGLSYYAKRRIMVVGNMGELEFGSKQGDQSAWFVDIPAFRRVWDSDRQVFLDVHRLLVTVLLGGTRTPYRLIDREGDKLLVTNH
jgi:hypothetical protein